MTFSTFPDESHRLGDDVRRLELVIYDIDGVGDCLPFAISEDYPIPTLAPQPCGLSLGARGMLASKCTV